MTQIRLKVTTNPNSANELDTSFLIREGASGEVEIVRDGQPLLEADRSTSCAGILLSVEPA